MIDPNIIVINTNSSKIVFSAFSSSTSLILIAIIHSPSTSLMMAVLRQFEGETKI